MKLISDELVDEIGRLLDIGMREGWQDPREMLRNLSEAKMLDLGEVESHPIVEWYTMWGASDEEALVRYSDLTNAVLPETKPDAIPIPTVEEIADHIDLWFRTGEDKPWNFLVEDLAGSIHSLLTDRLKGGADHE